MSTATALAPAVTEADKLHYLLSDALERVESWLKSYGDQADPGVHAIEAAGHELPDYLRKYGTSMKHVAAQFRGLAWAMETVLENTQSEIPDTTDEQNSPANIRRLLGQDEPAAVVVEPEPEPVRPTDHPRPAFLSTECGWIMKAVADHGPLTAKEIVKRSGLDRTRSYILTNDLREQGLIVDRGQGYELATPAVRDLLTTLPTLGRGAK